MESKPKGKAIPKATAKRIPLYFRYLKTLNHNGVKRIKSQEFSKMIQIPSATIRRDFSHFGELGRSGYGYDVPYLIEVFSEILNTDIEKRIALIGVGNLGRALVKNNFRRNDNLNIVIGFDTNEDLIGTEINRVAIENVSEMQRIVEEEKITTAIMTVPSERAQIIADELVEAGVTAILNFAPKRIKVPHHVQVQYIDLTTELQTLIYYDENYNSPNLEIL